MALPAIRAVFAILVTAGGITGAGMALAQDSGSPVFELDLGLSDFGRDGNALNSSGGAPTELDKQNARSVGLLAAFPLGGSLLFQGEATGEWTRNPKDVQGSTPSDTYDSNGQFGLQFGQQTDATYLGLFAGKGKTRDAKDDRSQDTRYHFAGLSGAYYFQNFSLAAQLAKFDGSAQDEEMLYDARMGKLTASYYFPGGRIGAYTGLIDGVQDPDDAPFQNPMQVNLFGIDIEYDLGSFSSMPPTALYASYSRIRAAEDSTSGRTDRVNTRVVTVGLRMTLGAQSTRAKSHATAPRLPRIGRIIGSVSAVD